MVPAMVLSGWQRGQDLVERLGVHADRAARRVGIERQRGVDAAAGEAIVRQNAGGLLQAFEAFGDADADVEAAGVHAAHFPVPTPLALRTLGAGEAGHAGKRHRFLGAPFGGTLFSRF